MKKALIFILILFSSIMIVTGKTIEVTLQKCVDGDTAHFNYKGEIIKARFLAIDTPETVHPQKGVEAYGKAASNYTCDSLTYADKIVLEYDSGSSELDKYNRHLVWVFVDDSLLQKELVQKGYAKVAYLYGKYKYTSELEALEEIAKNKKAGIWGEEEEEITKEETGNWFDWIFDMFDTIASSIDGIIAFFKNLF